MRSLRQKWCLTKFVFFSTDFGLF
uniref:Uncharacterized protein n=1 Tax=Anguilla anguilla TaxID=7936 RepID=A0A0E9RJ30_ANGAN